MSAPLNRDGVVERMVEGLLEDAERDRALVEERSGVGVLDRAWAECEAALPEGWAVAMLWGTVTAERWGASAGPWPFKPNDPHEFGGGDTPAAALRQLAGRLAERDRTTGTLTLDQLRSRSEEIEARRVLQEQTP